MYVFLSVECYYSTHSPTVTATEVIISPEDSRVTAGDSHTIHCTVTNIPYLVVSPTMELIGPRKSVLATDISFTLSHTLDPVMTSHAGQYTCRASVNGNISGQSSSTLILQSMSVYI